MSSATQTRAQLIAELLASGRRVSRASLLFRDAVADAAGLHVTDAECIDFLLEAGELTAGQLASAAGLTSGAMSAAIDRLERAGFVERRRDAGDRRKVVVRPVMARIAPFVPLYESLARRARRLYSQFTIKELQAVLSHNQQLADLYQEQATAVRRTRAPGADVQSESHRVARRTSRQ